MENEVTDGQAGSGSTGGSQGDTTPTVPTAVPLEEIAATSSTPAASSQAPPLDSAAVPVTKEELNKALERHESHKKTSFVISLVSASLMFAGLFFFTSNFFKNLWSNNHDYSPRSEYSQQLKEKTENLKKRDLKEFSGVTLEDYVIDGVKVGAEKRTYPEPDFKDKRLTGSSFYVKGTSEDFVTRIKNWTNYLDVAYLLPNIEGMSAYEVGNLLQKIGDKRIYGTASRGANAILFRSGDYSTFVHEVRHLADEDDNNALMGEPGSYAVQAFVSGDYKAVLDASFSGLDDDDEKMLVRILTEAIFVGGSETFVWLQEYDRVDGEHLDYVGLTEHLKNMIEQFKEEITESGMTPQQYLVLFHKIPVEIADKILEATKQDYVTNDLEQIIDDTNETKKAMISSFKALTSFYYINLGYSLPESIGKAVQHFKDDEAETIAQTLFTGAKEVYARFSEYNVPEYTQKMIVEAMISNGAEFALKYAEQMPKLLDLTSKFGNKGWVIVNRVLRNQGFRSFMIYHGGLDALTKLYEKDPSVTDNVIDELMNHSFSEKLKWPVGTYDATCNKLLGDGEKISTPERAKRIAEKMICEVGGNTD